MNEKAIEWWRQKNIQKSEEGHLLVDQLRNSKSGYMIPRRCYVCTYYHPSFRLLVTNQVEELVNDK